MGKSCGPEVPTTDQISLFSCFLDMCAPRFCRETPDATDMRLDQYALNTLRLDQNLDVPGYTIIRQLPQTALKENVR